MAFRQIRISDVSGLELADADVVTVVVKDEQKVFDASAEELKALKPVKDVMELELKYASGQVATILVGRADFDKLIPADKLAGFASSRGRRPGFSPRSNGA
jgi:hypothetical protein